MTVDLTEPIRDAVSKDFFCHSPLITDLCETSGVLGGCRTLKFDIKEWMAPVDKPLLDVMHGTSTCQVMKQPQALMGNISP